MPQSLSLVFSGDLTPGPLPSQRRGRKSKRVSVFSFVRKRQPSFSPFPVGKGRETGVRSTSRIWSGIELCRQPNSGGQLIQLEVRAQENRALIRARLAGHFPHLHLPLAKRITRLRLVARVLIAHHIP